MTLQRLKEVIKSEIPGFELVPESEITKHTAEVRPIGNLDTSTHKIILFNEEGIISIQR